MQSKSAALLILTGGAIAALAALVAALGTCAKGPPGDVVEREPSTERPHESQRHPPERARSGVGSTPAILDDPTPRREDQVSPEGGSARTRVRCVAVTGGAISGASIEIRQRTAFQWSDSLRVATLTADSTGEAAVDLGRGGEYMARATADGFVPSSTISFTAGLDVRLKMSKAARVHLEFMDDEGRKVEASKFLAVVLRHGGKVEALYDLEANTAGVDLEVPQEGNDPIVVYIVTPGYANAEWSRAPWGDVPVSDVVVLKPGIAVRGRVLDGETDLPVGKAAVHFSGSRVATETSDSGEFTLTFGGNIDALSRVPMNVSCEGYAPLRTTVEPNNVSGVECRLARGESVVMKIANLSETTSRSSVRAELWLGIQGRARGTFASIDERDDLISLGHLAAGRLYCGVVHAAGCAVRPFALVAGVDGDREVTIVLVRACECRGRLKLDDAAPVGGRRCEVNLVESSLVFSESAQRLSGTSATALWSSWRLSGISQEDARWVTDSGGNCVLWLGAGTHCLRTFDAEGHVLSESTIAAPAGSKSWDFGEVVIPR